jgi:transcriptional regulator with XRE-family HTH domain
MSTVVTNDEAKRYISHHLRRLWTEAGEPSLREIGESTGESHAAIGQYLNGEKMAGAGPLKRLAEFFSIRLDRTILVDELLSRPKSVAEKNLRDFLKSVHQCA